MRFAAALEQRDAQARLQIAHLLGNARLGNAEPVRRAAETAGLGHGEEVAQMADFQRIMHRDGILCSRIGKCNEAGRARVTALQRYRARPLQRCIA